MTTAPTSEVAVVDPVFSDSEEHLTADRNPILDRGWKATLGHDGDSDE